MLRGWGSMMALVATACAGGGDPGRVGPTSLATTAGGSTAEASDSGDGDSAPSTSTTSTSTANTTTDPASSSSGVTTGIETDTDVGSSTGPAGPPACPAADAPLDCSPGPGSGENDTCTGDPSCFLDLVQNSVTSVIAEHPEWFKQVDGTAYVLDVESYMNAVVERIGASECSIRDPNAGDELVVKHDNAFAENFDILAAEGFARWGDGIYTSKCIPAWF